MSPSTWRYLEGAAFTVLFATLAYCWLRLAPAAPLSSYLFNPAYAAMVGASIVAPVYLALRLRSPRRLQLERLLLAMFLAAMPLVYLWAALLGGDGKALTLQGLGLLIFGAIAIAGYRRSLLLLGIGIVAHGSAWDAWQHGRAGYIEAWYPYGCLLVDLALGGLVTLQALAASRRSGVAN